MDVQRINASLRKLVMEKTVPGISWGTMDGNDKKMTVYGTLGTTPPFCGRQLTQQQYYDLASLTKVVGTTTRILQLIDEGQLQLSTPLATILPQYSRITCTIEELLLHRSGLPADFPDKHFLTKAKMQAYLRTCTAATSKQTIYSDLGYFLLGAIINQQDGCSLERSFQQHIFQPMGMGQTSYQVKDKQRAVPTEITTQRWIIQGVVQDSKAYQLKEPIGSAGLFSTLNDLMTFAANLLANRLGAQGPLFSDTIFQKLWTTNENGRSLGWEVKKNQKHETYLYHTGFTGTTIGLNLQRKTALLVLTNRTYPDRQERDFLKARERLYTTYF